MTIKFDRSHTKSSYPLDGEPDKYEFPERIPFDLSMNDRTYPSLQCASY